MLFGLLGIAVLFLGPLFRRWPSWTACIHGFATVSTYIVAAVDHRDDFLLASWFVVVALFFEFVRVFYASSKSWRDLPYQTVLLVAVPVLLIYADFLYPRIKPEYGGGYPAHVMLYFQDAKQLPVQGKTRLQAQLIDETEQGYYVRPEASKVVYFVPREVVGVIEFIPRLGSGP